MNDHLVSRRDLDFLLFDWLGVEGMTAHPRFADHSRETFTAAIDMAHEIAAEKFATHNRKSDEHEPTFDGQRVHLIPEVKEALDAYIASGMLAADQDYELGGMQLPYTVMQACIALFNAANVATATYAFITSANANLLRTFGSDAQKAKYLPNLYSGRFFGTMCLSEPQAGSSLGDIRTTAEPQPDGTYRVRGNKMWISTAEHELSENIVHLVLAKIPGGPPGVKGISLFIVPKFLVNDDGSPGERNDTSLAGLNHKMGFRGTTNCVFNFGERGGAVGELIGEPNQGMRYMFHMMNEARIWVGLVAASLGCTGYLHSLAYARERTQGRTAAGKDPTRPPARIVEHADVRRMLLLQKMYAEGALALCLYCARLVDESAHGENEAVRHRAHQLLDLLTPVTKSWPSQWCLEANSLAIQVHGGYGYTREYPVEQFYRDNRLNPIHEGTNGIQALDLLGRKVGMDRGAAVDLLEREMREGAIRAALASGDAGLAAHGRALADALADWLGVTRDAVQRLDGREAEPTLSNASAYLDATGHLVIAWIWLEQALVAARLLPTAGGETADFLRGKRHAASCFFAWELPKVRPWLDKVRTADRHWLDMQDAWF